MKLEGASRRYKQTARAQSAEETRKRIIEAFLARLMSQWFDEITLDSVAADADVTVQTVVRRFGGKEGLLGEAVRVFGDTVRHRRATPSGQLNALVNNLVADYEASGDGIIRLLAMEERHDSLKKVLAFGRGEHRQWVTEGFAPLLEGFEPAVRKNTIDGLIIATDVYTWKLLRRDMGRSVAATAATIKRLIESITTNPTT